MSDKVAIFMATNETVLFHVTLGNFNSQKGHKDQVFLQENL